MKDLSKFKKLGLKVSVFGANHYIIGTSFGVAFISYDWDYSRTTMKYLG